MTEAQNHRLPTFIIFGTMKGGTTSLHRYLKAHPDISMSRKKETDFFLGSANFKRGLDWYSDQFEDKAIRGESSPNYAKRFMWQHNVPQVMAECVPDALLIFIARDPISRTESHWMHNISQGRERRPFMKAIRQDPKYLETSSYTYQVEPYIEAFGRDQIHFMDSDELKKHPVQQTHAVLDLLGARKDVKLPTKGRHNVSASKTQASWVDRHFPADKWKGVNSRLAARLPEKLSTPQPISRPKLSDRDRAWIADQLREDAQRFREISGLPFSQWSV